MRKTPLQGDFPFGIVDSSTNNSRCKPDFCDFHYYETFLAPCTKILTRSPPESVVPRKIRPGFLKKPLFTACILW